MRRIFNYCGRSVKFFDTVSEAVAQVKSGDTILMGGFGVCGIPNALCVGLTERKDEVGDLTIVNVTAGIDSWGPGVIADHGMVKKLLVSYIGECDNVTEKYWGGDIEVEFTPLGTICEKMRSGYAGCPVFYTRTGVGTMVEKGGIVMKHDKDGNPELISQPKETREFNGGETYLMEEAVKGDIGLVKGWKADRSGNIICRGSAMNINCDAAMASEYTIVEVEEIVEIGELDPHHVHIQSIYVDAIVCPEPYEKLIEFETFRVDNGENEAGSNHENDDDDVTMESMKDASDREQIARRLALEYEDGMYANLGIGMPALSSNYVPEGVEVILQSENGILGLGPYPTYEEMDADYTSAAKQTVTLTPGASLFKMSESFGMIRGSHIDVTCLGALEVSQNGDIANWVIPQKNIIKGMGEKKTKQDLVAGTKNVIVCMSHLNKHGESKVKKECSLPLTGQGVVKRLITDLAVFDFEMDGKMVLKEKAWWVDVDEIQEKTEAEFEVCESLKDIEYSL